MSKPQDDLQARFEERTRETALAHGAEAEAIAAAFTLAVTVECSMFQDGRRVMNALNAYWRAEVEAYLMGLGR